MLALIYLALAIYLGDLLCRRFYRFACLAAALAKAGVCRPTLSSSRTRRLLASTWFTYLAGLAFMHTAQALLSALHHRAIMM
jgi:hypothetical protein